MASMLSPILSVWISAERRRLVQVVPDPMREVWDKWDLRGSVLISIVCHLLLLSTGKIRKHTNTKSTVWAAYLMSDWVANFALGVISSKVGDPIGCFGEHKNDPVLIAFWGALLLVHLGGPPTITAEALEDNVLWRRTLVLWLVQTIRVLYIVLLAWRSTWFSYFSIGMLVVGFIKCGERTWALYSASVDNSMIESERFNKERKNESATVIELEGNPLDFIKNFMSFFVSLFVDLVLSSDDLQRQQRDFRELGYKKAFEYVEKQLEYAFDFFYTKAYVMFRPLGRILGACTICITTVVFTCFCIAKVIEMHGLSKIDQIITWSLVVGVVLQEIYTFDEYFYSYWNRGARERSRGSGLFKYLGDSFNEKKPKAINKCNLLTFCLQNEDLSWKFKNLKSQLDTEHVEVNENLKEHIYSHLKKSESTMEELCSRKCGVHVAIEERGLKSLEWTTMLEFHQSILMWHVATDLCYYGIDDNQGPTVAKSEVSKTLSDYMLYLLVKQRHMLPIGRGVIAFCDTYAETMEILQQSKVKIPSDNVREDCKKLLQVNPDKVRRSPSNSALLDSCRLARSLINEMETVQRWEFLAAVWVEILGYAATHCRVDQHAQQLRKGGEFLTHVWLLMAHLGVMEQFQVTPPSADTASEQSLD